MEGSHANETAFGEGWDIRPIVENSTDNLGILQTLIKARSLKQSGNCKEAIPLYSLVSKFDPNLEEAVLGLVNCQFAMKRADLALKVTANTNLKSKDMVTANYLAEAIRLPSERRLVYLEGVTLNYQSSRLFNLLGETYSTAGDSKAAKLSYSKAKALGQNPGVYENNLGVLLFKDGNYKTALTYFEKAKELAPYQTRFDNNRRLTLLLDGQYVSALKDMSIEQTHSLLLNAAHIAMRQNEIVLAETLLEHAIEIHPTYFAEAENALMSLNQK